MLVWRQVYKRMREVATPGQLLARQNGVLWYAWPAPETNTRTGQPGMEGSVGLGSDDGGQSSVTATNGH